MYRVLKYAPRSIHRTLYFSLIHPHITYCISAWGSSSICNTTKINVLQRRAFKMKGSLLQNSPKALNLMNLNSLYKLSIGKQFYKFVNKLDSNPDQLIDSLRPQHNYGTRHTANGSYSYPICRTTKFRNSFLCKSIEVWNSIHSDIRTCVKFE